MGFTRIVRCSRGHLFTTVWMPLGSLKAVRLGPLRYQRCPACGRFRMVRKVDERTLSPQEREQARARRPPVV